MTPARKQELEERAEKLYRLIWDSDLILGDLTDALEKVEREVWEKAEQAARTFSAPYDIEVWETSTKKEMTARVMVSFADWCREQGGA